MSLISRNESPVPSMSMALIDRFCLEHERALNALPGEIHKGDITGHGSEWRTEMVVDYRPSDDAEESENEHLLVFSLFDDAGCIIPCLSYEYRVAGVGVTTKQDFDLSAPETIATEFAQIAAQRDMHKTSTMIGQLLIDKVLALRDATIPACSVDWTRSKPRNSVRLDGPAQNDGCSNEEADDCGTADADRIGRYPSH